jgi:hypothetical protein
MGGRGISIGVLIVFGIIVADFLTHAQGTTAAANGLTSILTVNDNALLGGTSGKSTQA